MAKAKTRKYVNPDRLADVLALIQVLALHEHTHRSENGLTKDLQGKPRSAAMWADVAREHPEFFRFREPSSEDERQKPANERHCVSLLSRHVLPEGTELPTDFVGKLLESGIHLHDREVSRSQRLKEIILPLFVALVGAIGVILAARGPVRPSISSSKVPVLAAAPADNIAFEQVKLLAEYTLFHIGLYATLASALIALVSSEIGARLRLRPTALWVAVVAIAVAGLAGGVIASSLSQFRSVQAFMYTSIGPYDISIMPGQHWAYLEHTSFWLGVAAVVYAFARRDG